MNFAVDGRERPEGKHRERVLFSMVHIRVEYVVGCVVQTEVQNLAENVV